jgi:hypothetical protein
MKGSNDEKNNNIYKIAGVLFAFLASTSHVINATEESEPSPVKGRYSETRLQELEVIYKSALDEINRVLENYPLDRTKKLRETVTSSTETSNTSEEDHTGKQDTSAAVNKEYFVYRSRLSPRKIGKLVLSHTTPNLITISHFELTDDSNTSTEHGYAAIYRFLNSIPPETELLLELLLTIMPNNIRTYGRQVQWDSRDEFNNKINIHLHVLDEGYEIQISYHNNTSRINPILKLLCLEPCQK